MIESYLGHAVVDLHSYDPGAQADGSSGHFLEQIGRKALICDKLLANHFHVLWRNVVLVILHTHTHIHVINKDKQ